MKFRSYLTANKILSVINIVFALVSLVILILGSKSIFEMVSLYGEMNKDIPAIALYLRAINQIVEGVRFNLEILLAGLTMFFAAKNFKLVYGKIREYF
ncbi:MAG: hypothetical protein IJM03_05280 [Treponema sp.]|nr:hypothetical protein [Treponema sp.]